MRKSGLVALALVTISGVAAAQPPAPRTKSGTPTWVRQPTSADIERYYPEAALKREASGDVLLTCQVTKAGLLEQCTIEKETPAGLGFGQAALKLQPLFEMAAKVKGSSVAGASVTIPIGFRLYPSDGPAPPPAP